MPSDSRRSPTNTTGSFNTALGYQAGSYAFGEIFAGSDNIYIGAGISPATADESYTIRIGHDQTQTFIGGISGTGVTGSAVYVDPYTGQLGIQTSSRRYKEDIEDMGDASSGLMKLRPVAFHYKPEYANGPRTKQYGLIAEEVAEVYPDLVQYAQKPGNPSRSIIISLTPCFLTRCKSSSAGFWSKTKTYRP
ncbi:MAG: tail fiber domain-containing protein [Syntrophobacteraceae bacterium]